MRVALWVALASFLPAESFAQEKPKILVLDAKGSAAWGGPAVVKSLRAKLTEATGHALSVKDYAKALKDQKLKGDAPETIAKGGKAIGADFVLQVTITKKGWAYTANAVLINTTTAEQQMDFKSGYYKPQVEAADRGERIARVTLEKIELIRQGGGAVAVAPPPPPPSGPRDVTPPPPSGGRDVAPPPPPPKDPPRDVAPPPPADDRVAADPTPPVNDRVSDPPPTVASTAPPPSAPPPSAPAASSASTSGAGRPEPITEPMDGGRSDRDLIVLAVTGGAGVLHTHSIDYGDGQRSTLSYQTDPLSLAVLDLEVLIHAINLGVLSRVAFSPVRFTTAIGETGSTPGGILLDLAFGLKLNLTLSGAGRDAIVLAPALGMRVGLLSVAEHPANLIHGSTAIAPFVGGTFRLPFADDFELGLAFDFGVILSYSETPEALRDGELGSGIQLGAGANLKYWLSDLIGIAFDTRFDLRSISLSGPSLRQAPPSETLEDVSIGNKDLRLSLGVALRL